ncbi:MAG: ribonuclease H-like domain-containing protein [Candidatus Magasanikbacteria bacterium]|nr:ribonuclease H-like domain-containing protein [Candidatus Magasanikbacteria bacterium]
MPTLIFDVETVGEEWGAMDETTQTLMTKWLKRESYDEGEYEKAMEDVKTGLGFSPLTGEIVALGVWDLERLKGAVYYNAPGQNNKEFEEDGIIFKQHTEPEMLEQFWLLAKKYNDFVTYNGRGFDVPYMMVRSAVHKIKPSKNLLSNRYLNYMPQDAKHYDLMDQLSFYGTVRKKGSLHLWCRALGIESPKAGGVTGEDVAGLFKAGKCLEIAKYNVGDLKSTGELYLRWKEYFNI